MYALKDVSHEIDLGVSFKNADNSDSEEDDKIESSPKQAVKDDSKDKNKQIENNSEGHTCEECGKSFRLASGLRTHSIKHGKKLKCEVCGKEFNCKLLDFFLEQSLDA